MFEPSVRKDLFSEPTLGEGDSLLPLFFGGWNGDLKTREIMGSPCVRSFLIQQVQESTRSLTPVDLIALLGSHQGIKRRQAKMALTACVQSNHLVYRQVLGRTVVVRSLNCYHPLAPGVFLVPPHLPPKQGVSHCISMNESISFGNGTHPTTQLCAEFMVNTLRPGSHFKRALDLGTGTGVLSLLAIKLGVEHVDGTEIDPIALHDARQNAILNGCSHRLSFHHAHDFVPSASYDLITANLRYPTLISMVDEISGWLQDEGELLLSGIKEGEEKRVLSVYEGGFDLQGMTKRKGWVGLHLRKRCVI